MAKRFTDTAIWEEDWYIDLPNKYKLFWNYVKDKCDSAGFWRPNKNMAQKIIEEAINLNEFLMLVNSGKDRILVLPSGKWFLKDYFSFQYGDTFSPKSPVHKSVLKILIANGMHISELLNGGAGNLKNLDLQQLKQIAYDKGKDSLTQAYE